VVQAVTTQDTPVRLGPGTDYPIVGILAAEQEVRVYARTGDGEWLQVDPLGFTWVAAGDLELDTDIDDIQVANTFPPVPIGIETPTPAPTPLVTPGTPVPTPALTPDVADEEEILISGGLGLTQAEWELFFGEGTLDEETLRYQYLEGAAAGGFDVGLWEDRIWLIYMQLAEEQTLSPGDLAMFIGWLIPLDSEAVETDELEALAELLLEMPTTAVLEPVPAETPPVTETPSEWLVTLYQSEWLAQRLGEEAAWIGEPGLFVIQYEMAEERVISFTIFAYIETE
jgi:hypothetical protein